ACEIQVLAQAGGAPLTLPAQAVQDLASEQTRQFAGRRLGEREWIALMREVARIAPDYAD
ncbi:MAG: class II aldolase/adducin family protein, partial [Sphingomonadales bacterium]|nr:class II aldolase/adducin family protein [Sphingomonadales bacterium]